MVENLTLYTVLSLTTTNPIDDGGRLKITFNNVEITATEWVLNPDLTSLSATGYYFVDWVDLDFSVTNSSNVITLEFDEDVESSQTFTITVLTDFDAASPTVQATSYCDNGSTEIDTSSTLP